MKTLFLIRHGKSSWNDTDLTDRERPLKKRGRQQACALSRPLKQLGAFEGDIHVSPAARARETAACILGSEAEVSIEHQDDLYTFSANDLLSWLQSQSARSPITIIGHNPALLDLANHLLDTPLDSFPTGAALQITLPGESWRQVARQTGEHTALLLPEHLDYKLFARKAPKAPDLDGAQFIRRIPESLAHQAQLIEALEPGVRLGHDPEFLHQFRINLRRSRAIAEALQRITKDKSLDKGIKGLKRQAQATSQLRDLDVFLETLSAWRDIPERSAVIDSLGIEPIFRNEQTDEHQRLCETLDSDDYHDDLQRWKTLIHDGTLANLVEHIKLKRIHKAIDKQIARHNRLLEDLSQDSPDSDFHRVRKALKRVRYLLEVDPDRNTAFMKELKSRQKLLGRFQDRHVQVSLLRDLAYRPLAQEQHSDLEKLVDEIDAEKMDARSAILSLTPLRR